MWRNDDPPNDDAYLEAIDIEVRVQRARIPHTCWLCGQPIRPGQRYTRIVALVEGELGVHKHHGEVAGECCDPE